MQKMETYKTAKEAYAALSAAVEKTGWYYIVRGETEPGTGERVVTLYLKSYQSPTEYYQNWGVGEE